MRARAISHLLKRELEDAGFAGERIDDLRRGDGQAVAVHLPEPHLLGTGPGLVPGHVEIVGHLVAFDGVGAGVADHAAIERLGFRRGWDLSGRRLACGIRAQQDEPPVGAEIYVAVRRGAQVAFLLAALRLDHGARELLPRSEQCACVAVAHAAFPPMMLALFARNLSSYRDASPHRRRPWT